MQRLEQVMRPDAGFLKFELSEVLAIMRRCVAGRFIIEMKEGCQQREDLSHHCSTRKQTRSSCVRAASWRAHRCVTRIEWAAGRLLLPAGKVEGKGVGENGHNSMLTKSPQEVRNGDPCVSVSVLD
jgi:hypothetical protein